LSALDADGMTLRHDVGDDVLASALTLPTWARTGGEDLAWSTAKSSPPAAARGRAENVESGSSDCARGSVLVCENGHQLNYRGHVIVSF